ncbi:MAG: hypothetical protein K6E18_05185 [Lachnospiraceae bacterium]|nr:hypothetical protein [Lachnospiraceae bacterium]
MLKKFVFGLFNFMFRASIAALVVVCVYRLAMYSYHFGYMVFADAAKEPTPGRDIVVTLENTEDVLDLGRILKSRGVIDDEKIFYVQERLSDYHKKLVPGTYTFNTAMPPSEIFAMMGESYVDETEGEGDSQDQEELPDYLQGGYAGQQDTMTEDGGEGNSEPSEEGIIDSEESQQDDGGDTGEGGEGHTPLTAGAGL